MEKSGKAGMKRQRTLGAIVAPGGGHVVTAQQVPVYAWGHMCDYLSLNERQGRVATVCRAWRQATELGRFWSSSSVCSATILSSAAMASFEDMLYQAVKRGVTTFDLRLPNAESIYLDHSNDDKKVDVFHRFLSAATCPLTITLSCRFGTMTTNASLFALCQQSTVVFSEVKKW